MCLVSSELQITGIVGSRMVLTNFNQHWLEIYLEGKNFFSSPYGNIVYNLTFRKLGFNYGAFCCKFLKSIGSKLVKTENRHMIKKNKTSQYLV